MDDPMEVDPTADISSNTHSSSVQGRLPAQCQSEEQMNDNQVRLNAQVDELLEDWPRSATRCPANTQDWQSLYKKLKPRVTFSERSSMYVYRPDPSYVLNKSYTKEERRGFSTEALTEAIRIKKLVLSTPGASTKDSFKFLLKNDVITLEEIVGIEHLVLGKSASKLLKERQDHAKAVLMKQCQQRMEEGKSKLQDDSMTKLGEFSASRSMKSVKRARIRAAMAA